MLNFLPAVYLAISRLVLRAEYGIWLYQFLIIAYLFALKIAQSVKSRPKRASFWTLTTRPYLTEQVLSILQPDFRFQSAKKKKKVNKTAFMKSIVYSKMLQSSFIYGSNALGIWLQLSLQRGTKDSVLKDAGFFALLRMTSPIVTRFQNFQSIWIINKGLR